MVGPGARLLILGSFPSEASLAAGHYYAHPRNLFWTILGQLLGEPLAAMPFERRYAIVVAHGIAIWDVISACRREGSLDSAIRDSRPNDFSRLRELAPGIERVVFNGRHAGRYAGAFRDQGYDVLVLPSTSPAHAAMPAADKLAAWRQALSPFLRT
ncbi:DNA-deoxyinosine glycosylase [Burkholderiaceae bacterium FT117]|uniref:DNA-deoxyinosine glycosylase n=1 Tax=Zeimonas sediminis TaxID=2944268 RepID=UPI002342DCD3|nr:DNA-deoxyinosine glycosylase [Zeimonas sediminis]MCM5568964.1 DNA-deoxyinosine glycosylase [Zeimonas sediminis]